MMTAYLAARLNARPVSTGSRIRAATSRLAHVVRGRRKTFGCATRARQPSGPCNDMREPGSSRSNTRTGRDRTRIETGGQVSRHHNLLPSFLGRESFAPPLAKGMIEYGHDDQIPAFLLR